MRTKSLALIALFAAACATQTPQQVSAPAPRPDSLRYTVLMSTNTAGSQVVARNGDEETIDFEFNDRGRGPKSHTVTRLDARGVPVSLVTTGNDYFKQQVEEHLDTTGGTATWKNNAENGSTSAGAFFTSMYGAPEEAAILARALLKNGGTMDLLPAGKASIRKAGDATLRGTHVTAYEISGLGFSPLEIWLDDDLNLFGSVSSWQSVIREGFEGDVKQLLDAQDARSDARVGELAKKLTQVPFKDNLTILNARIFDPRSGTLSEPQAINIEGNRIVSVGARQQKLGTTVDADGRVVIPGLWDMHTHSSDTDPLLDIASGITSVRDLGNDSDYITGLKSKIERGEAVGPRIWLAGLVDGPGPFQGPTNQLVATEEEARKSIDFFAGRGYEGLKIYSSVKPELVPFMTKYAHEKGLRVSGHIPAGMRADDAIDAGYDEIQHINMLLLNFMPDVKDTRTPARFIEPGKRAADLDLKSAEVQAFIQKLKTKHVAVDPTLVTFEGMYTARLGEVSPAYAAIAKRLPPQVQRFLLTGGLPVDATTDARYRASYQKMIDFVGELYRGGVTVVAGTDALAGFSLHRELELYAKAGIPNADVLCIATLVPAQLLKREHDLGTIEPGKLADLVILEGNPLDNISNVRNVVTVVKDGKVYDAAAVLRELGIR